MHVALSSDGELAAAVEKSRQEGVGEVTLDGKRYLVQLKRAAVVPQAFELDSGVFGRLRDWWNRKE